ncbi:hypothetical protein FH972_025956 [Carpinus fangiana]|uniref:Nucleolar complex-associated protein 3 n=1 Tax=Carpinus fangiana TaxID=176857 RepID=A0A5N6L2W5_9ROSI|nr:hypothetical protein FH972_025956 [Carpinus fangiana]
MPPNKRRKLSPPEDVAVVTNGKSRSALTSSFAKNAVQWNLEQDYENRPRKQKKQKDNNRLPIKTQDGLVEQYEGPEADEEDDSDSSFEGLEEETLDTDDDDVTDETPSEAKPQLSSKEQILQSKEELARIASLLAEDPEEHISALKTLSHITSSDNATVTKLGLVTQCAVYKDIIPGYRIRPLSEQDSKAKVSKDVRKLRSFEQSVVGGYQKYVRELQRISALPKSSEDAVSMATVATRCACDLVNSVPHFNYRSDLLKILVDKLSRRGVDADFVQAREAIEKLFAEDEEGNASLEAAGMLSKMADATVAHEERDHNQGETLKLVFGIYFRVLKTRVPALTGAVLEGLVKFAHLINQDFFGDLLEALKELILEAELPDDVDEDENAHDAQDSEAEAEERNITRESLLCVITAFALLQGQDASGAASTLHLDLDFFTTHLYRTLYPAALNADIELSHKSLHLPDPHAGEQQAEKKTKVNVQTTVVLLLRSLTAVLLPSNARSVPPVRLAAFTKQILTAALQLPEKSATAMLGLTAQTAKTHKKRIAALWNTEERRGDGVFDPLRAQIEGSNPFAATVWEGELLKKHYAPSVREGVQNLESIIKSV